MEKELFNLLDSRHLKDEPLVYLHAHFKHNNNALLNNWVWFSRDDLQQVIDSIDAINTNGMAGDGVRLYQGIYNNRVCEYLTNTAKPAKDYTDHEGHNTIFFVPTYSKLGEGEHIDNILKADADRIRKDYDNDVPIDTHSFTGGYDVGTICPPPANCSNSGSHI